MRMAPVGKRRVLGVVSAAIVGVLGVTHAPWPALAKKGGDPSKASRKCRSAIGTWGYNATSAGLTSLDVCHKQRDAGHFNGDCNVIGQKPPLSTAIARGTAVVSHACSPSDPVAQNYTDGKVSDTIFPGIEQVLEGSGKDLQGEPSIVGSKSNVKCHAAVGKARSGIVREVVKRSVACQHKADKKATQFGPIVPACIATPGSSVTKARKLIGKACGGVTGVEVGSCNGLPDCLIAEATATGQVLARGIYGGSRGELCGNGVRDIGEDCDDGNKIATDACTDVCKDAECGDGIVEAGV
jgi:cysteine-rich repeat protein